MSTFLGPARLTSEVPPLRGIALSFTLVVATTALVAFLFTVIHIERIVGIYILPVLIASIRWGFWPGIVAALTSVSFISLLFTPPLFSFPLQDWEQTVRFVVFILVAVFASKLADSVKHHAKVAERAMNEARLRAETEHLHEALIGSVSHELRTPLSSIIGATTVLASAPSVTSDPKLLALAGVVRGEAERLNNVIQNLLDATRISSAGLRPRLEWAEVADIVNAALERRRARLADHPVEVDLASELPLVYVDQVLIEQALGHVIENAAKYSAPGTNIKIGARIEDGMVAVTVTDHGAGLSAQEQTRLGERFFRGDRTAALTTGSGLGVWIAKAFLHANGGSLAALSAGTDRGATFILRLPIPAHEPVADAEHVDNA